MVITQRRSCPNQNPNPNPNPNQDLNIPMDLARIKGHDEIAQLIKGYYTVRDRQTASSRWRVAPYMRRATREFGWG